MQQDGSGGLGGRTCGQTDRAQFGALRRPHSGRYFSGCVLKPLNWNSCSEWWVYTLPGQPRVFGPPGQSPRAGPAWPGHTAAHPGSGHLGSSERGCSSQAQRPPPPASLSLLSPLNLAFVLFCFNNLNNWHRLHQPTGWQPVVTLSSWPGWWLPCASGDRAGCGEEACKLPQRWKDPLPLHPMSSFPERERSQEALNNPPRRPTGTQRPGRPSLSLTEGGFSSS